MTENGELSALLAKLEGKAAHYFPAEVGSDSTFELTGVSARSYSTIYFFQLAGTRKVTASRPAIAVKVFREKSQGMETAELQYRALVSLSPQFGNGANFSLPQPLDYFSDLPALVMERVRGTTLQQLFGKIIVMPSRRRNLTLACERTGRWLSQLHAVTSIVPGKLNVEEKLVHATTNLAKLGSMGFSSELRRQCADLLDWQADQLAPAESKMALVHGDFTVDNVMVDGDRIVALDLTGRDYNAIEHDLATFLNSLRLLRLTMPVPRALLNRCGEAFLVGYFGVDGARSPALQFLQITGLISAALEIADRRWDRFWTRLWVRRFFSRELGGLVRS